MRIALDSETEVLTVDGVKLSFELLKHFAHPDPAKLFSMVREGDVTTVYVVGSNPFYQAAQA